MSDPAKNLDPAFQGIGQKIGIEIWRIENFQPVLLPKTDYGKFYSGDSYIVFQTSSGRGGAYIYDVHYWIGKDTSQDEAGTAAIKTVELDAVLGGRAIQHRELQGFESDKFLSYFKPCIIPLEGGVASGFKKVEEGKSDTRLYVCKGKRFVRLKQVSFARSSLNHDDVLILDTKDKIYQFNGANSNIQERAKALEVIQHFKDTYHEGKCDVAIIDDGNLAAESDSGDFWVIFGGFAPIGRKTATEDDVTLEKHPGKLYSIVDAQLKSKEGVLSKTMLENNKCYLLDCGAEAFFWFGRVTQVEERKAASQAAELFINDQNRPKSTCLIRVIQGCETRSFKSNFDSWPMSTGVSSGDEGRGKVTALLKWKGVDVKGTSKSSPVNDEIPILLESGGKIEVWRINGSAKTPVSSEEIGKFYSGDCYVVLYTYHSGDKKDNYFLSFWIGKDSTLGDREMADRLTNTMYNSLKGRPLQGRIFQGKEPPQFIALFQPMVVLKGGISSGYKKSIAEMNLTDETYTSDGVALIQISNTSIHNNKAVQVDAVGTSLSSTNCFLLQSPSSFFIWNGNSSTFEQQQLAKKVSEFLKPGVGSKHVKEGKEISAFWSHLGGKQSYSSKQASQETCKDPHLFAYSLSNGKFEILEVFNFSQDDLLTEDILILDTHAEVFVWVGHSVNSKEKQTAFDIGQKYIDLSASLDGLSLHVPLYKITEGNEPCFFTSYFSWDTRKATVAGDSYAKKLSLLFGTAANHATESKSNDANHGGPTQRASALAALSSAFKPTSSPRTTQTKPVRAGQGSQRAAAVAALSNVLTAEQKKASEACSPQLKKNNSPASEKQASEHSSPQLKMNTSTIPGEPKLEDGSPSNKAEDLPEAITKKETTEELEPVARNGNASSETSPVTSQSEGENNFSYKQLTTKSTNPAKGINYNEREAYLSDDEFITVMGMAKVAFYKLPKWKQDMQKRKVDLF